MLKRIRQLHISLAAKCQLLFGAAVALILGAALFVPWQRMEQLTEQLNERSARTLADYAVGAHAARPGATTRPGIVATVLNAPPTAAPAGQDSSVVPPRL